MIKDSFLGAKVWARLEPRPFPQLRQPVVYRSKVVESLWQRGCLSQISYSLAVWAVFFSSVFFPKVLFLQTILKTCCFFFSNLIVIRALLIKNKCNKAEWLGYFYIFLFKKKKKPQWVNHNELWCISSIRMENKPFIISALTHSELADTETFYNHKEQVRAVTWTPGRGLPTYYSVLQPGCFRFSGRIS